ncbi:MAG: TetR/AcrR family transcriptional regulator [Burkholderiaceae bacterium]|nr:TetR/AcrR family transcriptional regulator [Burkholderiaceae bacterium]
MNVKAKVYAVLMKDKTLPSRREEYADATRAALLNAAKDVFVEEGYQQAAVEVIARKARVTRGAFYHHFEDKKALFEALVVALQADAATRLVQRAQGVSQPLARLKLGTKAFLEVCTEQAYRRLVIQDAPAVLGMQRCREIGQQYPFGLLTRALAELKDAGVIKVANVELTARMIGAMICEAALLLENATQPKALERQALEVVDQVFASLRAER